MMLMQKVEHWLGRWMKHKWVHFVLVVALISLASHSVVKAKTKQEEAGSIMTRIAKESKPEIVWGVKADTQLFGFYNIRAQEIQGFDIDIAKAITDELTHGKGEAVFVEVNSKTRIPLLKNGNIDAIIATMTISEERLKVVDFSDVYFQAGQSLLVPEASPLTSIDDLTSASKVLAIKGSTSAKNIRELAPQAQVLEMENYSEGFVALQSGQGDALTTDNSILLGMMSETPGFKLAGENFTDEPYGVAINKDQKGFTKAVNKALAKMKADGRYEAIFNRWFKGLIDISSQEKEGK